MKRFAMTLAMLLIMVNYTSEKSIKQEGSTPSS